ncbi:MAG TPA: nicotinamide-nucleotide adenylyltransferase [Nitrososphaeraceae archaeon]|nr:nicotinamide-nucleotide adenylyltransferase [Nitrososphaeraceae archaeon]
MYKYKRGLIIGRFQPFHNGHLKLLQQVLNECEELIIAIGSSQFNYLYKDPFTAGERIEMIHATISFQKLNHKKIFLIPLSNFENNACWFEYLNSMVPKFEILYSGNEYVRYLCKDNIIVKEPIFFNKKKYKGENIRRLIVNNKKWNHLVPSPVTEIIMNINGIERIKILSKSDTFPQKW